MIQPSKVLERLASLRTGAAAGAAAPAGAFYLPLASNVWSSPNTSYQYSKGGAAEYGKFNGTKGAVVYAPEAGTIFPLPDGQGFVLTVHDKDNDREYIGSGIEGINKTFGPNEAVAAGQALGRLTADFVLALKVTDKTIDKYAFVDPVDILQRANAKFYDLEGAHSPQAPQRQTTAIQPVVLTPLVSVPSAEVAIQPFKECPPPPFTLMHIAAAGAVGGLLGIMMARMWKR